MKALIAVRERQARIRFAEILEARGHEVEATPDEGTARRAVEKESPEFVLVDLDGDSAARLCNAVRARPGGERIYTLVVSWTEPTAGIDASLEAGADDFLTPPPDPNTLHLRLDIAERRVLERRSRSRIEDALQREQAFFQQLFRNSPAGIVILDNDDRVVDANRAFVGLFQYKPHEIWGRPLNDFIVPESLREEGAALSRAVFRKQTVQRETVRRRKDGTQVDVSILGYPVELADERIGAYGIYTDITERKQAERRLFHEAFHDSLTGLPNRSLLTERLERALRRARRAADYRFALLFLDLDRFKVINDSLGHAAGDEILVETAHRLESCVRPGDTTTRLGGDEFTLILDDLKQPRDATRVADRILSALARPFHVADQDIVCSASIGIAFSTSGYRRAEELIRDADIAMYRAKARGRSRYAIFDREMHRTAVAKLKLETELRRAVENNGLSIHYQPVVEVASGALVGLEALVRWKHPQRGLLEATDILSVGEEAGLLVRIGQWVLRRSCRQLATWREEGRGCDGLVLSLNLSLTELSHSGFLQSLEQITTEIGIEPTSLALEIKESSMAEAAEDLVSILARLRDRGFHICIDGFGVGGASLAWLNRFPVDGLKVHRTFLETVDGTGKGLEILRAITDLGNHLGLRVVAEGVETEAQLAELRHLAVDWAQGYYFSRPLPAAEAGALLSRDRRG